MIRTTVVGSWPPETKFKQGLQNYFAGDLSSSDVETLLNDAASVAITQQKNCGLDEYTGGETSADMFILHFPNYFSGIERTNNVEAWDGRGEYRLVGDLDAPNGLGIASAFRREKALDHTLNKVTIPGPSEILMMIDTSDKHNEVWTRVIELMRLEIAECIAIGAKDVQLDLPHVAMGLVDNWWKGDPVATIREIFKDAEGVRRSVHFCYGDFQAKSWTENRNFHALLPTIKALDGIVDRVVVEFSLPEQWAERQLLAEIPSSMEVAVGIIDVKSQVVERVSDVDSKIRELLNYIPGNRLLICPSCGLGRRTVKLATGKVKAMVEAVGDVNRSLIS